MPTISYGSTFGGIPIKHAVNNYAQWCNEMGFTGPASVTTGKAFVFGALVWCASYDDTYYKWCDVSDGYWKDTTLDRNSDEERIEQLTCLKG